MIVDLTEPSDQMKIIDTLNSSQAKVSVIDVRAGGLSPALGRSTKSASSMR